MRRSGLRRAGQQACKPKTAKHRGKSGACSRIQRFQMGS